ncbi:hypothetical protein [Streptomyces sp. NPDC055085]
MAKLTVALLALVGVACLPGTAGAATPHPGPLVIVNNIDQVAGGDIVDAGRDNFVGAGNGGSDGGVTGTAASRVYLQTPEDTFTLQAHTGDANFRTVAKQRGLDYIEFTTLSTAVYVGHGSTYELTLRPAAGSDALQMQCIQVTGFGRGCEVNAGRFPGIIMW